jgi:hypothetical protein
MAHSTNWVIDYPLMLTSVEIQWVAFRVDVGFGMVSPNLYTRAEQVPIVGYISARASTRHLTSETA